MPTTVQGVCPECGSHDFAPMLYEDVWAETGWGPNDGWFCTTCVERRLGRPLGYDELDHTVGLTRLFMLDAGMLTIDDIAELMALQPEHYWVNAELIDVYVEEDLDDVLTWVFRTDEDEVVAQHSPAHLSLADEPGAMRYIVEPLLRRKLVVGEAVCPDELIYRPVALLMSGSVPGLIVSIDQAA